MWKHWKFAGSSSWGKWATSFVISRLSCPSSSCWWRPGWLGRWSEDLRSVHANKELKHKSKLITKISDSTVETWYKEIWFHKIPDTTDYFLWSKWIKLLYFVLFIDYWHNKIFDVTTKLYGPNDLVILSLPGTVNRRARYDLWEIWHFMIIKMQFIVLPIKHMNNDEIIIQKLRFWWIIKWNESL